MKSSIKYIVIAADHAAFNEKEELKSFLAIKLNCNVEIHDCGTFSSESCHYPDLIFKGIKAIKKQKNAMGIFMCGTGIGVSMVANRFKGIRAALCRSVEEAVLTRQHNDANVLCMGARVSTIEDIKAMTLAFLDEEYQAGRHQIRLDKFDRLGEENVP